MPSELATQQPTVMEILSQAVLSGNASVDVVERLVAMQRQMSQDEAELRFNQAMHRVQEQIKRIDRNAKSDKGRYADYAHIDRTIRPIYTAEGFSLSFSDGVPPGPEMLQIIAYLSHTDGHTRMYRKDMPIVTTGAKGNEVMTKIHAHGSADSYAKRYLVKDIFNIAIGEDDDDGNGGEATGLAQGHNVKGPCDCGRCSYMDSLATAHDVDELTLSYRAAFMAAEKINDWKSIERFKELRDARKKALTK